MKHLGHIEIKSDEVIFVYHELEKPKIKTPKENLQQEDDISLEKIKKLCKKVQEEYEKDIIEYEASKREAKVDNVILQNTEMFFWIEDGNKIMIGIAIELKNKQSCEAKIKNHKAIITKIT